MKIPLAFAFRQAPPVSPEPPLPKPVRQLVVKLPVKLTRPAPLRVPPGPALAPLASRPAPVVASPGEAGLDQASRLADEGRLPEAAELCEAHLRSQPTSVRARYLLGLVRDAAGELAAAREHYRQALYLDPNHHEALAHLALVTAKLGDEAGARQLRERARRVEAKLKRAEPAGAPPR